MKEIEKINVVSESKIPEKIKFSERFRGILTKEEVESLKAYVKLSSEEWDSI